MRLRMSLPRRLIRAMQIAVLIGLVVLIWRAIDVREALAFLSGADPRWLLAAALALTLQTVLSAQRWRITAAQLGVAIPAGTALREYYLSQVVNQSLPGGMIGDAGRAVRMRGDSGLLVSGQAVLFERLSGQLGLLGLLLTGFALTLFAPVGFDWPQQGGAALLGILAVLACVLFGTAVLMGLWGSANHALRRFADAFAHAVLAREVRVQQVVLSVGTALCNVAAFAFCAVALDVALPLLAVVTLVPLILFAMILPLSVSGWGLREGAAALLFPVVGATASAGLATSVAFGLVFLATVLPGVVLPLMRPNTPVARPR